MAKKSRTISIDDLDQHSILVIAFGAALQLGWDVKYAGDGLLIAYASSRRNRKKNEIRIEVVDNRLTITSKRSEGEWLNLFGKNKKYIAGFLATFEKIKDTMTEKNSEEWRSNIMILKEQTAKEVQEWLDDSIEIDRVMNFSSGSMQATYSIMAINIFIFLLMAFSGAGFFKPTSLDVLKWGGNLPVLTFGEEWWRLITNIFVHSGIIHLAGNMIALLIAGSFLEPMLGKMRYLAAYLCAGIMGSMASILWHRNEMIVSAGASGAVFGLFGVALALLSTRLIPKQIRSTLLATTLGFVVYNLLQGFKSNSGIDHVAHIGGLFTGAFIGYMYYFTLRKPSGNKTKLVTSLLLAGIGFIVFAVLRNNRAPVLKVDYETGDFFNKEDKQLDADVEKFSRVREHFSVLEEIAIEAMRGADSLSKEEYLLGLQKTALVDWTECVNLMDESGKLLLPEYLQKIRADLRLYAEYRIEQTILYIKAKEEETDRYNKSIDSLNQLIIDIAGNVTDENAPLQDPEAREM